jgi:uncharacterized membrane protein YhhN
MKKFAILFFCLSSAGVLLSGFIDAAWLQPICKPLIMASLLLYYLLSSNQETRSKALILAIIFSLAGDVLLLKKEYFIPGLIAFLLAHLLYIFAYRQHKHEPTDNALLGLQRVRLAFPVILAGTGLVVVLFPVLGDLKIPVIIYATVIAIMTITALFRFGHTAAASFWMVFIGACLFMLSDSILAINKFLHPIDLANFWIMITYSAAQYLIVSGLLKHPHK